MHIKLILLVLYSNFIVFSANSNVNSSKKNGFLLKAENFQKTLNGKQVDLYFLKNGQLEAAITNYGGRLVGLRVPSKNGQMADVVLGFNTIDDYLNATGIFHGAIIGRFSGRIQNSCFDLNGTNYKLPANIPPHQLHGGVGGFHNQVWDVSEVSDTSIVLSYLSEDGEMGYPGNLKVTAIYSLTSKNELTFQITATTDKSTPVNFTNHPFFNLAGEGTGTILNHILAIPSNYFCEVDASNVASGKLLKMSKSVALDFRKPKSIGSDLLNEKLNQQLKSTNGYDHRYVLSKRKNNTMKLAATVVDPQSGRKMEVFTNEPCVHFFTASFAKGADIGKFGKPYILRESFAIETQGFPLVNRKIDYHYTVLNPDEKYFAKTIFRFSNVF